MVVSNHNGADMGVILPALIVNIWAAVAASYIAVVAAAGNMAAAAAAAAGSGAVVPATADNPCRHA